MEGFICVPILRWSVFSKFFMNLQLASRVATWLVQELLLALPP